MAECASVTQLLRQWREGDADALAELIPLVYAELRRLAGGYLRREGRRPTLQPTELVNEAFVRLMSPETPELSESHALSGGAEKK